MTRTSPRTRRCARRGFSPWTVRRLHQREHRQRTLRGLHGAVELTLSWGRDPRDQRWCCPLLEAWGVRPHLEFTPAARRRLGCTVSASGTSAEAAELAAEWGLPVDDSTLHALVQPAGGWIGNWVHDQWAGAEPVLDFYHASPHRHALAEALHGGDQAAAGAWVRSRGADACAVATPPRLLGELAALEPPAGPSGATVRREQNYLAEHAQRMNYRARAEPGSLGAARRNRRADSGHVDSNERGNSGAKRG